MSTRGAFVVDLNKCTGCHACALACQIANDVPLSQPWREVRTFNELHVPGVETLHLSLACNHCRNAPCMQQCPARAYSRDDETGAVLIAADKCLGCGYCAWACPYDAPRLDDERGVMTKCTFCNERLHEGREPACVTGCPTEALTWRELPNEQLTQDTPGFAQAGTDPSIRVEGVRPQRRVPLQTAPPALPPWASLRDRLPDRISLAHEWPLAVFTFLVAVLVGLFAGTRGGGPVPDCRVFAGLGGAGMLLSASHLGRKDRAWRAPLHLDASWLSREILLVGGFLALATMDLVTSGGAHTVLGTLALAVGVLALLAIDRVYGPARVRGDAPLHSAEVLGTGLLVALALGGQTGLAVGVGVGKLILFGWRQRARQRLGLAAPFGIMLPRVGLLVGGMGWLAGPGTPEMRLAAVGLLIAGEALDRALYYEELEIPTPASLMLDELETRPEAGGDFGSLGS